MCHVSSLQPTRGVRRGGVAVAVGALLALALPAASLGQGFATEGSDILTGNNFNNVIDGRGGNDVLDGRGGNDRLIGGSGSDLFFGGPGDDRLFARDGQLDVGFNCGSGFDRVEVDLVDFLHFTSVIISGCNVLASSAVQEGPNVAIARRTVQVDAKGETAVRLRCPRSLPAPCAGTVKFGLADLGRDAPPTDYSLPAGRERSMPVRLSARDRRTLRRRGRFTGYVTSVERGQFGDKTTIQTVIARASS